MTELDGLSLNGPRITDAGLVHLETLPKLKNLWLRGTAITDEGYRRLQAALPQVRHSSGRAGLLSEHLLYYGASPSRS